MIYKMNITIENPQDVSKTMDFEMDCEFSQEEKDYYGNGYHLVISYVGIEQMPEFIDLRYDTDFNPNQKICALCDWANYHWSGEKGSWRVKKIFIERV